MVLLRIAGLLLLLGCGATSPAADASVDAPALDAGFSFIASPSVIVSGESSTLRWPARSGEVAINGMAVTGTSLVVTPTKTIEYTLTAGVLTATTTVTVRGSSAPTDPIAFVPTQPLKVGEDWVLAPTSYDARTPMRLLVWLHGCGGSAEKDLAYTTATDASWLSLAVGGKENGCWDMNNDPERVLSAIAACKTHFNVMPRGTVIAGYSSGGDLAYRTAFYNAAQFAGVLVENTSPFRDTGSSQTSSVRAAAWRFNVVHLAHLHDAIYPLAGVRAETDALVTAGFPLTRVEVEGDHWDEAGAVVNGQTVPGTYADIALHLLPALSNGWSAP